MGFFKRRTILIVLVLFFIAIQLFSLDLRERNSQNPVSKLVLNITYYPQMAVSGVTDKAVSAWRDYVDLMHVNEENKRLREELPRTQAGKVRVSGDQGAERQA